MRIAYFTDTYLPQINGVTNTLEKLGNYLSANGIEHMFFAPHYPETYNNAPEKNVRRFKSVNFPLYPECRLSIPLYHNMSNLVDSFNPDIIHITTPMGIGLMGLRYAGERGIPVVSSFHTNFDAYLKYYKLEYFEDIAWNFFRWFHGFSRLNFCPSMDTLKTLEAKGIENLRIWSRGIDTKKFSPVNRDNELRKRLGGSNKTLFLYVGRLAAEKDLDILMQSILQTNELHPGEAVFVLVGDGPYAEDLKKMAPDNVVFTGYKKGQELAAIYASCDVFAFPSSTETFGNVVLEAMASGTPVIAVNSGGVKDSIIHEYNGLLCRPRDSQSFTAAISTMLQNKEQIDRMSSNALEYTKSKSWDRIFSSLVADYSSVISESWIKTHKSA
ncbi:MAG: glycosyltransferase family 1 protein [Clostridia bacterium]|nr:glycosyltransferase family 1 protein [Clostridia bacterium]